jgi:hypothetical protein
MINNNLHPKNIADIILRVNEYLENMRMDTQGSSELIDFLDKFIRDYFHNLSLNELELKTLIVEIVDAMYLQIVNFMERDIITDGYFGIIVNRLFWELAQNNVLMFFVLDNQLRDDRFKLTSELFGISHFTTIYPYNVNKLEYGNGNTQFPIKEYKEVEKQIKKAVSEKKHIFYLEKDNSVNYLPKVLSLAEEFQDKYVCVFRNQAPDIGKATWLMGSFSDKFK